MLLAVGLALAVRCFMGLSDRPLMLVGGWEKPRGRCCSTWCFSASTCDLKVFLRPGPQARPHVGPMSGPYPARHESNGGNPCVPETSGDGDSPEPSRAHGSVGPPQPKAVADDRSGSPDGWGSSSGESSKEKQDERISVNSYSDSGVRTPLCRICFQGPEQGELLSPCRCSGSVRCTHEPCLIKWISERGSWSCELCYYKYHVIGISTKNPLQWQAISLTVIEKVQIAAAVLGSLFLVASISWLAWSSVSPQARWQRQDLLFQICYAMYGFMDLVCVVLIIHEGPSVFRIFHRWQAINQRWKVLNYDKARDLEEQQKPGSTPRRHPALPEPNARMGPLSLERLGSGPPSPATSSLLVAVAAAEAGGVTTTLVRVTPIGQVTSRHHREEEEDLGTSPTPTSSVSWSEPGNAGHSLSPVTEQNRSYRWTYSLLHLLGHSRPLAEPHGHDAEGPNPGPAQPRPQDANRELIMRVTTV